MASRLETKQPLYHPDERAVGGPLRNRRANILARVIRAKPRLPVLPADLRVASLRVHRIVRDIDGLIQVAGRRVRPGAVARPERDAAVVGEPGVIT